MKNKITLERRTEKDSVKFLCDAYNNDEINLSMLIIQLNIVKDLQDVAIVSKIKHIVSN